MGIHAHDIRRLATCFFCKQLGAEKLNDRLEESGVPPLLRFGEEEDSIAHARCFVHANGFTQLAALSSNEIGKIRLCDLSAQDNVVLQAVLARREKSKDSRKERNA